MSAVDNQPDNPNPLNPINFRFNLLRAPSLTFFCQSATIPTINIGELCLTYGGGGHQNAGTCQVENEGADKKFNEIIEKIHMQGLTPAAVETASCATA